MSRRSSESPSTSPPPHSTTTAHGVFQGRVEVQGAAPWSPTAAVLAVAISARAPIATLAGEDTLSRGLRTPPLPATHASVGDCWQNSRCRHLLLEEQHTSRDTLVSHANGQKPTLGGDVGPGMRYAAGSRTAGTIAAVRRRSAARMQMRWRTCDNPADATRFPGRPPRPGPSPDRPPPIGAMPWPPPRPRPALRPARAAERPDRPGPARRRLPGLDPRQGPALADHLVARGDLDADDRAAVEALVALHLKKHGGDAEQSLAAIPAGRSTRESLAGSATPTSTATLAHVGSASTEHGRRRRPHGQPTPSARPPPTASGSASSGPTPGAAWAPSSWPSTPSCTARWR